MQAQLKQLASELGLDEAVQFPGPLFGHAKWAAYRDADVFVLPSQNENFGNTAAEAVAAGTPVIVTEQCGIAPLLADQAGLVVPHDATALASILSAFFAQPELRQRLKGGCAPVTSRLGWEEPVRQMESLYAEIASNPGLNSSASRGA
jgi:glycosyltransferase involved in cell wall biosynthesis